MPSVRMVLLKEILPEGFVFYTNYTSRKSGELLATGKAAFVLHWKSLRRQIRVTGLVEQVPADQSDAYFQTRSRGSRIGAWASQQSQPLNSRAELAEAVSRIEDTYADGVPRPPHWGGFLIRPAEIEFWADGEFRLHDRFRFTQDSDGARVLTTSLSLTAELMRAGLSGAGRAGRAGRPEQIRKSRMWVFHLCCLVSFASTEIKDEVLYCLKKGE